MTSSNGNIFRVTGPLCTRPVTQSFDLRLNKRLSKQSWGWWFETPSRPLWRHCNVSDFPVPHNVFGFVFFVSLTACYVIWRYCLGIIGSDDGLLPHDDVIKWKHFPPYWPYVRGIHRSPVNYPHKGQWRGALMFYLICAWINGWANNYKA